MHLHNCSNQGVTSGIMSGSETPPSTACCITLPDLGPLSKQHSTVLWCGSTILSPPFSGEGLHACHRQRCMQTGNAFRPVRRPPLPIRPPLPSTSNLKLHGLSSVVVVEEGNFPVVQIIHCIRRPLHSARLFPNVPSPPPQCSRTSLHSLDRCNCTTLQVVVAYHPSTTFRHNPPVGCQDKEFSVSGSGRVKLLCGHEPRYCLCGDCLCCLRAPSGEIVCVVCVQKWQHVQLPGGPRCVSQAAAEQFTYVLDFQPPTLN